MSIGIGRVLPIGVTSRSASTLRSRVCEASGMSPISSRNSVPPSAESTRPFLPLLPAPVKEPAS